MPLPDGPPPDRVPGGAILPAVIEQETRRTVAPDGAAELEERTTRPVALAILLIVGGALGLLAAFELTLDKFQLLEHPAAALSCNFNLLVQCGKNLGAWQGSLFGFPNPLIGLMTFPAPIVVGVALLAGSRFPRWFWSVFNLGLLGALVFIIWLMTESIFVIGTLCPWCMLVWSVVIPMFVATTLYNLREGNLPAGPSLRRAGAALYGWTPLITLLAYVLIAVLAQLRLDVLGSL